MAVPFAQVQQRAATLLVSVEASPLPDASSIQGTASALAKLLSLLGAPLIFVVCVRPLHTLCSLYTSGLCITLSGEMPLGMPA